MHRFWPSVGDPKQNFVDISVPGWAWATLIGGVVALLLFDIMVVHQIGRAHV